MANIIDSFVVALGLDASKYKLGSEEVIKHFKKTKDEAARTSAEIEQRGASAAQFFGKLRTEALALLAVFTAGVGIKNFTENTIGTAAGLGFMSDNLGISTEKLTAWQKANERAGGSQAGIMAQLRESASESAKFKMGQTTDSQQWFYRLGGDPKALRDGNSFLLERSRIISEIYKKDPTRATEVAASMGITGDSFNLLKQGPSAVMALVRAQEKNTAVSREQAAAALALRNHWLDLRDRLLFTGTTILLHLMPTIDGITKKMTTLADYVAEHKEDIKQWIDKSLVSIAKFVLWADKAAQSVGGWKNVIIALIGLKVGAGLLQLAATLALIAGNLTRISAAGAAVGMLGKLGVKLGVAGVLAYDFINPKEANAGEEEELKNYFMPSGSAKRGEGIVANALGDLLFKGEGSYDSVNRGKKGGYRSGKEDLQNMTVAEVMRHQEKGDFNAAGKYQLIKSTLAEAVKYLTLTGKEKFNEETQDRIFRQYILGNKRKALGDYISGKSNNLNLALKDASKEFASIADPDTGKSYFAGVANNRASISAMETRKALMLDRNNNSGNTSTTETNFHGPITIQTQSTDPKGIATDFTTEVSNIMAAQANTGLN